MGLSEQKQVSTPQPTPTQQEQEDEARKLRRLQIMMNMVMSVISQDPELTVEEAAELAANAKRAALAMFPDKELAYDLLYRPRLQRVIAERFGVVYHERTVGKVLKQLGFSHISARPRHPAQDQRIMSEFKKTSRRR